MGIYFIYVIITWMGYIFFFNEIVIKAVKYIYLLVTQANLHIQPLKKYITFFVCFFEGFRQHTNETRLISSLG